MDEEKRKNPVFVLDADGVIMIPYTHPEMFYDQIPDLLHAISETNYVCIASKNPRAKLALEAWDIYTKFDAIRCGAHHPWKTIYQPKWRKKLSKWKMIVNMLAEIGLPDDHPVKFYDDDPNNFKEFVGIKSVECFLIKASEGVTMADIATDRSKFIPKNDTSGEDSEDYDLCETCRGKRKRKRDDDEDEEIPVGKTVKRDNETPRKMDK